MHLARILVNHLAAVEETIRRKANNLTARKLSSNYASHELAKSIRSPALCLASKKDTRATRRTVPAGSRVDQNLEMMYVATN